MGSGGDNFPNANGNFIIIIMCIWRMNLFIEQYRDYSMITTRNCSSVHIAVRQGT